MFFDKKENNEEVVADMQDGVVEDVFYDDENTELEDDLNLEVDEGDYYEDIEIVDKDNSVASANTEQATEQNAPLIYQKEPVYKEIKPTEYKKEPAYKEIKPTIYQREPACEEVKPSFETGVCIQKTEPKIHMCIACKKDTMAKITLPAFKGIWCCTECGLTIMADDYTEDMFDKVKEQYLSGLSKISALESSIKEQNGMVDQLDALNAKIINENNAHVQTINALTNEVNSLREANFRSSNDVDELQKRLNDNVAQKKLDDLIAMCNTKSEQCKAEINALTAQEADLFDTIKYNEQKTGISDKVSRKELQKFKYRKEYLKGKMEFIEEVKNGML